MQRLIDANALKYEPLPKGDRNYRTYNLDDAYDDGYYDAFTDIRNAPTIDAVPVIRCKDCYFYGEFQRKHYCTKYDHSVKQDGFCAWAESKENDR